MEARAFDAAARSLGCHVAAIRAVWDVEAAGRAYRADGTVERRYEPHHFPGNNTNWRDSLAMGRSAREEAFATAYRVSPEDAMRATSWGAPQIMGFNHSDAGYQSATDMVKDMAQREQAHLDAFVNLVKSWGIDSALRGHDWTAFARRYNGSGQVAEYARRMESAYRRHSGGTASPTVLRVGDRGVAVRRLQEALGMQVDGVFGPETLDAVRAYQQRAGLAVDGVVGARTWAMLERNRDARPPSQESIADHIERESGRWVGIVSAIAAAATALDQTVGALPEPILYAALAGLAIGGAIYWWKRMPVT